MNEDPFLFTSSSTTKKERLKKRLVSILTISFYVLKKLAPSLKKNESSATILHTQNPILKNVKVLRIRSAATAARELLLTLIEERL